MCSLIIIIMSNVTEAIIAATQQIQTGNANDLRQGLAKIANLSKQQLTANQTAITYPLQMLTQAVDRNLKVNQQQISPQLGLKKLLRQTSDNLPDKLKRQLMPSMKTLQRQTQQAQKAAGQEKARQERQVTQTKKQLQKAMNQTDKDLMRLQRPIKLVVPSNLSSIQQQVYQYRSVLDNVTLPQITRPQQIPQVMKLLTSYAMTQGLLPISSASNKGGLSYVGVKEIQDQTLGIKTLAPYFIENQPQKKHIPSISMQLQYYANKTMNSWNRYIENESQIVNFIGKVNTPTNRINYMQKQFRTLNIATFSAQAIATIAYYYLYLPLLKMASNLNTDPMLSPNLQSFLDRYEVGSSLSMNPLLLSKVKATALARKMFQIKNKDPIQFLKALTDMITSSDIQTSLNEKGVRKFQQYAFDKLSQARQFLNNNGIEKDLLQSVLASKDWSSVKKKKVLMSRGSTNPFVSQMARKIVRQEGQQRTKVKSIDFSWSNEQILANDYIWGWSTKFS